MIIQNHIQEMKEVTKDGINTKFNCWGATQYALGQRKKYGWVGENVMWRWIHGKTIEVQEAELEVGDVMVISSKERGNLIHTAVYLGASKWFHKEGKFDVSVECKKEVVKKYTTDMFFWRGDKPQITFHRVKPKKK